MSKGLIAFIVVAAIAVGAMLMIEMKKSADEARRKQEEILNDFRTVDKTLQETRSTIDSLNTRLIDSIGAKYK